MAAHGTVIVPSPASPTIAAMRKPIGIVLSATLLSTSLAAGSGGLTVAAAIGRTGVEHGAIDRDA